MYVHMQLRMHVCANLQRCIMLMALFLLVGQLFHFNVGNRVIMSFVINAKNEVK